VSVVSHRRDVFCYLKEVTKMERVCERDGEKATGGPKRNDETVEWRKLHNELHDL
jgi:hypothetical protein